jgi:hypothetical protein
MANLNPFQLLSMIRSGNPQIIAQQLFQNNFPSDPSMQNLMQMAQKGDSQGIQRFAQQYFGAQGKDFNTELNNFMRLIKGR